MPGFAPVDTALAPHAIHEDVRLSVMAHVGAANGTDIEVDGREVESPVINGGQGVVLAVEVPVSAHWAFVGATRYTRWVPEWEELAGYQSRELYDLTVAPKYGATLGRRRRLQLYLQVPLGVAMSVVPEERFDTMTVSADPVVAFTYGVSGGLQVMFGDSPVGFVSEIGARYYAFSQRYDYAPVGGAPFPPTSEDVSYVVGWAFLQMGVVIAL